MKKMIGLMAATMCAFMPAIMLTACSSLGVATSGANYFNGKKEADLVKYFKYDGEPVKVEGDYDKAIRFTNIVTTIYMDKTTTEKFKNRRYSKVQSFSFKELSDGCRLADSEIHVADKTINGKIHKVIDEDVPSGGKDTAQAALSYGGNDIGVRVHRNNNTEIAAKIKSFDNAVRQYGAVKKADDNAIFNATVIGKTYYVYNIESNKFAYSDLLLNSSAIRYTYILQSVSVYEDSKSTTDTKTAYIYNDREKQYYDADNKSISEAQAHKNESDLAANGYESRKKEKGITLVAYIKDGVVVKVESDK